MKVPRSIANQLSQWNGGAGISAADWICSVGRYDHFIGFSRLLWPEFVEHQGRVYLSDFFDRDRLGQALAAGASPDVAQAMQNALDLSQLFSSAGEAVQADQLLYLAATLEQSWSAKLQHDFPDRSARVAVQNSLAEPGIGELLVTICEA